MGKEPGALGNVVALPDWCTGGGHVLGGKVGLVDGGGGGELPESRKDHKYLALGAERRKREFVVAERKHVQGGMHSGGRTEGPVISSPKGSSKGTKHWVQEPRERRRGTLHRTMGRERTMHKRALYRPRQPSC